MMDRYKEFDARIFDITRIMVDFSLSEGQEAELRKVAAEMEEARQDGSLDDGSYRELLDTMADCGLDLRQPEVKTARERPRSKGRDR